MPDIISNPETVMLTDLDSSEKPLGDKEESRIMGVGNEREATGLEMEGTPIPGETEVKKKVRPPLDTNIYSTKKTVAQGMMDLALLTSNASQLKMVLKYSESKGALYALHISCLAISIILQVAVGVLLIINSRYNINRPSHQSRADIMNNATVVGIFLITVVNVLASSFGEST